MESINNCWIILKFSMQLCSMAAELHAKIQNNNIVQKVIPYTAKFHKFDHGDCGLFGDTCPDSLMPIG